MDPSSDRPRLTPEKASHDAIDSACAIADASRWLTGWSNAPENRREDVERFAKVLRVLRAWREGDRRSPLPPVVLQMLDDAARAGLERREGRCLTAEARLIARELGEYLPSDLVACRDCSVVFRPSRGAAVCATCRKAGAPDLDAAAARDSLGLVRVGSWDEPASRVVRYLRECAGCDREFWARRHQTACSAACRQRALRRRGGEQLAS